MAIRLISRRVVILMMVSLRFRLPIETIAPVAHGRGLARHPQFEVHPSHSSSHVQGHVPLSRFCVCRRSDRALRPEAFRPEDRTPRLNCQSSY